MAWSWLRRASSSAGRSPLLLATPRTPSRTSSPARCMASKPRQKKEESEPAAALAAEPVDPESTQRVNRRACGCGCGCMRAPLASTQLRGRRGLVRRPLQRDDQPPHYRLRDARQRGRARAGAAGVVAHGARVRAPLRGQPRGEPSARRSRPSALGQAGAAACMRRRRAAKRGGRGSPGSRPGSRPSVFSSRSACRLLHQRDALPFTCSPRFLSSSCNPHRRRSLCTTALHTPTATCTSATRSTRS